MLADLGLSHFDTATQGAEGFHAEDMPGIRSYGMFTFIERMLLRTMLTED